MSSYDNRDLDEMAEIIRIRNEREFDHERYYAGNAMRADDYAMEREERQANADALRARMDARDMRMGRD